MFLATTAIEEFWDTSQPIVFLGEWCTLYSRRGYWESLPSSRLPSSWEKLERAESAHHYCNAVYRSALGPLAVFLNEIHGIKKPPIYYEIILGNWLLQYIQQAYDKYICLKDAFRRYPSLTTWTLDVSQHYIPTDTMDMGALLSKDVYALQQYSQILRALGYAFPSKRLQTPLTQRRCLVYHNDFRSRLFCFLSGLFRTINSALHDQAITVTNPSFYSGYKTTALLLLQSKFKIILDEFTYPAKVQFAINHELRNSASLNLEGDEFQRVLSKLIIRNIPALFLEAFRDFAQTVKKLPVRKYGIFHTTNALHFNSFYKFHVADHVDDIILTGHQYGGGYGVDAFCSPEEWERSVVRVYYTWGWSGRKARYLPHPKLAPIKSVSSGPRKAVLVMTTWSRYVARFECHVTGVNYTTKNLPMTFAFCKSLNPEINLVVRLHALDYGWSLKERFVDSGLAPEFDATRSFTESLSGASVCIFDHLGTSYLESLAANKPTLIFIDPDSHEFRESARPYFELLRQADILHYSAESAAARLNASYHDLDSWWATEQIQSARKAFVEELARPCKDWVGTWMAEFDRLLATDAEPDNRIADS